MGIDFCATLGKHYLNYMAEREKVNFIIDEKGFCGFKAMGSVLYIVDMYVDKQFRGSKTCREYVEQLMGICRGFKLKALLCECQKADENFVKNSKWIQILGFKKTQEDEHTVYYSKEVVYG